MALNLGNEWRASAKCVGAKPANFDCELSKTGPGVTAERKTYDKRAARLCAGCPVTLECALDAIHHKDTGVIRAGIPLWDSTGNNKSLGKQTRARLYAVVREQQDTTSEV